MKLPGLSEKGKYATLIGILIALVVTVFVIISYIKGKLPQIAIIYYCLYGISIAFFILPSSLVLAFKDFKAEIKD